jgi:hypothetical protein
LRVWYCTESDVEVFVDLEGSEKPRFRPVEKLRQTISHMEVSSDKEMIEVWGTSQLDIAILRDTQRLYILG